MGIYRTYFDKNNTIIKNSFVNTGRNQISELYYGKNVSRFLFYIDLSDLKNKVNRKEIIIEQGVKHYLHIKNTSNFDVSPFLSENNNLVLGDNFRSSSFDLELLVVNELWDEGMGYDFAPSPFNRPQDRNFNEEASNWFKRTTINDFDTPGAVSNGTVISTQHFDKGNEDVFMDITDFVNYYLTNDISDYQGFILKYTDDYEAFNSENTYALGLFTRNTQTFFEPFIETVYDDYIKDDRAEFYLDKTNRLYLYVNVDGKPKNLDELPTAKINDVEYLVTHQTIGVYYIDVLALKDDFDTYVEYNDIWSNILIDSIPHSDIKLRFVPLTNEKYFIIGQEINEPISYGISLSGIKRDEKLTQGDNRRVLVNLRKPYTVAQNDIVTNIYYKLYIKQGPNHVVVIDWEKINKTFNLNYFNIDTTWLIPQIYYVDIKVERNGEVNIYNEELKFNLVSKFNN